MRSKIICVFNFKITLLGVTVIVGAVHSLRCLQGFLFYPICLTVVGLVMAFPIAEHNALVTLLLFVSADWERVRKDCLQINSSELKQMLSLNRYSPSASHWV